MMDQRKVTSRKEVVLYTIIQAEMLHFSRARS